MSTNSALRASRPTVPPIQNCLGKPTQSEEQRVGSPKSTHPATQSMTNTALVRCGITPLCITFRARTVNFFISSLPSPSAARPPFLTSRDSEEAALELNAGKSANQVLVNTARCEGRECNDWCTVNLCSRIFGPVEDDKVDVGVGSSKNFRQSSSSSPSFVSISSSDS
jgi:hypothetical protein